MLPGDMEISATTSIKAAQWRQVLQFNCRRRLVGSQIARLFGSPKTRPPRTPHSAPNTEWVAADWRRALWSLSACTCCCCTVNRHTWRRLHPSSGWTRTQRVQRGRGVMLASRSTASWVDVPSPPTPTTFEYDLP